MVAEASARRPEGVVAAIWFLVVGPAAVLYAGWVLVIDRAYFPRRYVLPLVLLYGLYALWTYRLGREHFSFQWTRREWLARGAGILLVTGAFVVLYAPALLLALGLAAGTDALWRRLAPASASARPGRARVALVHLAAFALLFPVANRMYLNHGVFYTLFAPEPPRLMPNPLFDVNSRGLRGPELSPEPDAGVPTVVLAGDSVMWGFPYAWRDTIARYLGDRLERDGCPVRLVNVGIPSQSISQIEARLDEIAGYHPRVVVLMVGYQWTRTVEHRERIEAYEGGFVPETEWVFLPPMLPEMFQLGPRTTYWGLTGTWRRWRDLEANREEFRLRLALSLRWLKRLGVELVVASHPALDLDEAIRERVRLEADSSAAVYVDVASLFSEKGDYAFDDAIHPNRAGQRRVADRLAEALEPLVCSGD